MIRYGTTREARKVVLEQTTLPEPVVIVCAGCGQKIRIPPEHFGDAGHCPKCKAPFAPVHSPTAVRGRARGWTRWIAYASWTYLAVVVLAAAIVHGLNENWTLNTLLLFAPRW